MNNLIVILPPPPLFIGIKNLKKFLKNRYNYSNIIFLCRNTLQDMKYYKNIYDDSFWVSENGDLFKYTKKVKINNGIVIILRNKQGNIAINEKKIEWFKKKFITVILNENNILQMLKDFPANHFFTKISFKKEYLYGEFLYYPYGFFSINNRYQRVDDFGFRIEKNYEYLMDRERNHFLVVILGGSTAWSLFNKKRDAFFFLLERKLNSFKRDLKFTVLNFSNCGFTLINEIITYLIFVFRLKPEFIISLTGFNDLHQSILLRNNKTLKKYKFSYNNWQEEWAAKLRNKKIEQNSFHKIYKNNKINEIVESFLLRIQQVRKLCENNNSNFIFALQPYIGCKTNVTYKEMKSFYKILGIDLNSSFLSYLNFIYNRIEKISEMKRIKIDLNLNKIFQFYSNISLFRDHVHLTEAGERIIANELFKIIKKRLIQFET